MKQYKYETEEIGFSIWTGRASQDYLKVLNQRGEQGWKFIGFLPTNIRPKGIKGTELIFEKEMSEEEIF